MKTKLKIYMPTEEEDAEINRGIAADSDTFVPTDEQFAQMKPRATRGRPQIESPKVLVSVRYDADIIDAFKAQGDGWQTRMNGALRDWLQTHKA